MKRIVVGLTGPFSSGKGVFAEILAEKGFVFYSLSDFLRGVAIENKIEISRRGLQDLGNKLRQTFGGDILARSVYLTIKSTDQFIVIDSIRNPGEIEFLRKVFMDQISIVGIDADDRERMEWYKSRAKERKEDFVDIKSLEENMIRDRREEAPWGQQVDACLDLADHLLFNYAGEEQFRLDGIDLFEKEIKPKISEIEGAFGYSIERK